MSKYLDRLTCEFSKAPPLPTAKTAKSPFGSNDSSQGSPVSEISAAAEAAREAAEERAAILEQDAHLRKEAAEQVAGLAHAYYNHLFGPGKATGCCDAPMGRWCHEGRRLRARYFEAAERNSLRDVAGL